MATYSKRSRLERTNVASVGTVNFNSPGTYQPPYGKTVFQLAGQGEPGNAPTEVFAGTNDPQTSWNVVGEWCRPPGFNGPDDPGGCIPGTAGFPSSGTNIDCPAPLYAEEPVPNGGISRSWAFFTCDPTIPGEPFFTFEPGNPGAPVNVLGVTLPGGGVDLPAPVIGFTVISIPYTASGVAVSVPPGGYVQIRNL